MKLRRRRIEEGREGSSKPVFLPPLRPRRRLLVVLSVVLVIWVAILLVMYIGTVYPARCNGGAGA